MQQIFLKLIEKKDSFDGRSAYTTWAYRVARNALIDRIRAAGRGEIPFSAFAEDLNNRDLDGDDSDMSSVERVLYTEQIKAGCSLAMLQCLKPEDRHIYILGEIFRLSSQSAAQVCGLSVPTYRKRLSRVRKKMRDFVSANCGRVNPEAGCRCARRVAVASGRDRLDYLGLRDEAEKKRIGRTTEEMEELDAVADFFRDNPYLDRSELCLSWMRERYRLLREE